MKIYTRNERINIMKAVKKQIYLQIWDKVYCCVYNKDKIEHIFLNQVWKKMYHRSTNKIKARMWVELSENS